MKVILVLFINLTILSINCLQAQNISTLYYDQNGKGLDTKKNAAFYRNVPLDGNEKYLDTVTDHYPNGKLLASGRVKNIDKFNNNNSYWVGLVKRYDEDGKLVELDNYDDHGYLDGIQITMKPNGQKTQEFEYTHGNPVKDYYLNYDKHGETSKCSYLSHLPLNLSTSEKNIVPFTQRKLIYQNGAAVQYYFVDGLSVAVRVSTKQLYGDYYEAFITIENGSGDQFNFDPTDITASLMKEDKVVQGEVLSYDYYIKKVQRRQKWSEAFNAFAQAATATAAGYSSVNSNTFIQSSSGRFVTVQSTSSTYNAGAQYAAMQNASNNVNNLANQHYDIQRTISEGYLKMNTMFPNSRLVGFVNIKLEPADHILINVPVNGKVYHFEF